MNKLKSIIKQLFINHTFRLFSGKSYNKLENCFLIPMSQPECDLVGVLLQICSPTRLLDFGDLTSPWPCMDMGICS